MAQLGEIWFGLGVDPVAQKVIVMTIAESKQEAERSCAERLRGELKDLDIAAWKVFNLMSMAELLSLRIWLIRDCKIPRNEIKNILEEFMKQIRPRGDGR